MNLHARAALTLTQRLEVQRLHRDEKISIRELAKRYGVNPTTIQRWTRRDSPLDKSAAPRHPRTTISAPYRAAVVAHRAAFPAQGPIRIAQALRPAFPQASRATALRILQQEQLTRAPRKARPAGKPLPVGHHRVQMDIQQLPAVQGGTGFEYKISLIHMRTRYKYSEIRADMTSRTVAEVLLHGLDHLPPFFSSGPTTP